MMLPTVINNTVDGFTVFACFQWGLQLHGSIIVEVSVFLLQYDKDRTISDKMQEFLK